MNQFQPVFDFLHVRFEGILRLPGLFPEVLIVLHLVRPVDASEGRKHRLGWLEAVGWSVSHDHGNPANGSNLEQKNGCL